MYWCYHKLFYSDDVFGVIDAFAVPRFTYVTDRKKFIEWVKLIEQMHLIAYFFCTGFWYLYNFKDNTYFWFFIILKLIQELCLQCLLFSMSKVKGWSEINVLYVKTMSTENTANFLFVNFVFPFWLNWIKVRTSYVLLLNRFTNHVFKSRTHKCEKYR